MEVKSSNHAWHAILVQIIYVWLSLVLEVCSDWSPWNDWENSGMVPRCSLECLKCVIWRLAYWGHLKVTEIDWNCLNCLISVYFSWMQKYWCGPFCVQHRRARIIFLCPHVSHQCWTEVLECSHASFVENSCSNVQIVAWVWRTAQANTRLSPAAFLGITVLTSHLGIQTCRSLS